MSNFLKIPDLQPDSRQLLSVSPAQFFTQGDPAVIQPVLNQLMHADLLPLSNPDYVQQLFQVTQLLQLSLQYFVHAQDTYANQAENLTAQLQQHQSELIRAQNQLHVLQQQPEPEQPTPYFVYQMQQAREANQIVLEENYRLKKELKKLIPLIQKQKLVKCQFCEKQFTGAEFLSKHVERRHSSSQMVPFQGKQLLNDPLICEQKTERILDTQQHVQHQNVNVKQQQNKEQEVKRENGEERKRVKVHAVDPAELQDDLFADYDKIQQEFMQLKAMVDEASAGEIM
ncbi:Conserved_hypothetical protein [Hexamita inflata]|uniref:C2H2-type domain-containing protein n=1 Tax=Hexamita inflata TaxID=28002 RepID=A0ABP1GFU9_9EUKA